MINRTLVITKIVRSVDRAITRALTSMLVLLFLGMLSLSTAQVVLRYGFHSAIPWADVAARNTVLWVSLLGAVLATRHGRHFRLDVLSRCLGRRTKLLLAIAGEIFGASVCGFLVIASERFLRLGLHDGGSAFLGVPVFIVAAIIPAGFGLMALQFVVKAIELACSKGMEFNSGKEPTA